MLSAYGLYYRYKDDVSTYIEHIIVTQIKDNLPKEVTIKSIKVNISPLNITLEGIRYNSDGEDIEIKDLNAYIEIFPLIIKRIAIKKLFLTDVYVNADINWLKKLFQGVSDPLKKNSTTKSSPKLKPIPISLQFLNIDHGTFILTDRDKHDGSVTPISQKALRYPQYSLTMNKGYFDISSGFHSKIDGVINGIELNLTENDDIHQWIKKPLNINVFTFKIGRILETYTLEDLKILSYGFNLIAVGRARGLNDIEIKQEINADMNFIKNLFSLKGNGNGSINLSGVVKYDGADIHPDIKVKGNLYLETLMEVLKVEEQLNGYVKFSGTIFGSLKDILAKGQANLKNGGLFGVSIDSLDSKITYSKGKMNFTDGSGLIYGGHATANAMITLPKVKYFTISIDGQYVKSKPIFGLIGWDPEIEEGRVSGHIESEGALFQPIGVFDYTGSVEKIPTVSDIKTEIRQRVKKVSAKFAMNDDIVKLTNGHLKTEFSDGDFSGTVDTKSKNINLNCIINTKDVEEISLPFRHDLKGGGSFNGTVQGRTENPLISGRVLMPEGSFLDFKFSNMTSNISYTMNRFDLKNGIADVNKGRVEFMGGFDFKFPKHIFDFDQPMAFYTAKFKDVSLEDINKTYNNSNPFLGDIDADMTIKGPAYEPTISGNMKIRGLKAKSKTLGEADSDYTLRGKTAVFNDFIIKNGGSRITSRLSLNKKDENDTWFDKKNVFYKVVSKDCSISTVDNQLNRFMGNTNIQCDFTGSGMLSNPMLDLHLNLSDKKINNIQFKYGAITGTLKDNKIKLSGGFGHDKSTKDIINISGNVDINDKYLWSLSIILNPDRYDFLVPDIIKQKAPDLKLGLNGIIKLNGTNGSLNGSIFIPSCSLNLMGEVITNSSPIDISLKDNNISIKSLVMKNGYDEIKIGGNMVWNESYNLFIKGTANLKPFKGINENILMVDGNLKSDVNILGSWEKPEITGTLNIRDGTIGLKNFIYYIRAIKGKININKNKLNIESLHARIGSGSLNVTGFVGYNGKKIEDIYIETKTKDIITNLYQGLEMNLDGDFIFRGDMSKNALSGNITINKAKYTGKFNVAANIKPSEKTEDNNSPINFKDTSLNINITGDKDILIKNELINTTASADLLIIGTLSAPNIYGKINTNTGKVYFKNNTFEIRQSSIVFDGSDYTNPFVETIADITIRNYNIVMNLSGRAKQLNLSFSSNYELKESEILSLLLLGNFSGDTSETAQVGTSGASAFLASEFQGVLTDRFKDILGVDRLMVVPSVSNNSTLNTQVSVSKWLIDQRLYVTASSTPNVLDNSIVRVEYIINKNLSLLGDSDNNGAIGGDIKFKVEFK